AHGIGLGQDDGSGLIVDGQEDHIRPGGLGAGELVVEVGLAGLGEGALIDDGHAPALRLGHKVVPDALGVGVVVAIDDGDLGVLKVLVDVLGGAGALVGIGEAHLEDVVVALDDVVAGAGGRQGEHPLLIGVGHHGQGGAGGDGAQQDLHSLVHQGVVGVDGSLGIAGVILADQAELDVA